MHAGSGVSARNPEGVDARISHRRIRGGSELKRAVLMVGSGAALAALSPAQAAPFVAALEQHAFGDHAFPGNGQLVQYWYPYTPYAPYPYYNGTPYPPAYYAPPSAPPAQPAPAPQTPGPPQFWYYCDNPKGYYPQVPNCSSAWRQVAAQPPAGNAAAPQKKP